VRRSQPPTCSPCATRVAAADIVGGARLEVGDQLTVEVQEGGLVARRGNTDVARFLNPSADLVRAVETSCGVAKGTVEQVHDLAGVAEIPYVDALELKRFDTGLTESAA
jgi:hypothetical protein